MDWESWLRSAANPPSKDEDSKRERTEQQIRSALTNYSPLKGRNYVVYTKGSYANNTNVRLDYDVDIAVEYRGFAYFDLRFELTGADPANVGLIVPSTDPYTQIQFKADIRAALSTAFGEHAVKPGNIAYRVREGKTTLPADVVPCWEYRRYDRIDNGVPVFQQGSRIYPTSGGYTENYPEQQRTNGIAKNNRTHYRYKYIVRALKRLQTHLVNHGLVNELPSYLIECLVFNVVDAGFGHATYFDDMRFVLAEIFNATLSTGNWNDWEEVNTLKYLFRGEKAWTQEQVHAVAGAAWDTLGLK